MIKIFLLLITHPALAQESDSDDDEVWDMSLSDILQLDISVASVKPESISSTPAVVSLYKSEDLQRMGFRNLHEFLSFVPGFLVEDSIDLGIKTVMVRGTISQFGEKVLMLLDGVPYWSPTHGQTPVLGLTFETIDRIEIIRGPGAVIYGSNAISGVINVITKQQEDLATVNASVGSNNLKNSSGYFNQEMPFDDAILSIGYEFQREKGFDVFFENPTAEAGQPFADPVTRKRKLNNSSMFAKLSANNYNVLLHMFENTTYGNVATIPIAATSMDHEALLFAADYTFNFSEFNYLKFYAQHNEYAHFQTQLVVFDLFYDDDGQDNYRTTLGSQFHYVINDDLVFLSGLEVETRKTDDYFRAPDELIGSSTDTNEYSAYAQFDYSIGDFRFLLGARAIDNETAGSDVNPRASAVYNISDNQSVKLLYSVGFTSPEFSNTDLNLPPVIRGNADLTAETISTIDFAYTYTESGQLFVANIYYYEGEDFITRVIGADGLATFDNSGNFDRTGFELDYQTKFDQWTIFANLAYNDEGDEEIDDDIAALFVPQYTTNIGISRNFNNHVLGGALQYISERNETDESVNLNLNYSYLLPNVEWFLTLTNVLEDDLLTPNAISYSDIVVNRGHTELSYRAGVKLFF